MRSRTIITFFGVLVLLLLGGTNPTNQQLELLNNRLTAVELTVGVKENTSKYSVVRRLDDIENGLRKLSQATGGTPRQTVGGVVQELARQVKASENRLRELESELKDFSRQMKDLERRMNHPTHKGWGFLYKTGLTLAPNSVKLWYREFVLFIEKRGE